jgi:hypothetical protein
VSEWNGATWIARGGALNRGADYPAYAPALSIGRGGITVAWIEPAVPFAPYVPGDLRLAQENR